MAGCIDWDGPITHEGYGRLGRKMAHRLVWEALIRPIPDGLTLDHLCHTDDKACPGGDTCRHRRCVNVTHLEPVTRAENRRRGRLAGVGAANRLKTECPSGHPYVPENILWFGRRRRCRECNRKRMRERKRPR